MSANPNLHPATGEASGESVLFVMAGAFLFLVAVIVLGALLPLAAGIAVAFGALAVVLVLVGIFVARLLGDV